MRVTRKEMGTKQGKQNKNNIKHTCVHAKVIYIHMYVYIYVLGRAWQHTHIFVYKLMITIVAHIESRPWPQSFEFKAICARKSSRVE